jgi:predicted AAA+ superfamily ATPase
MEFKRPVYSQIFDRLYQKSPFIQVISGPRQVGKTTLIKQLFDETHWNGIYAIADGLSHDAIWIESQFNAAMIQQQADPDTSVILAIDEIQKIPRWSETVKRLYDQQKFSGNTSVQLILLGSSNWLLQQGLSESLAGRFEQWNIDHWTFQELHEAFNITPEQYVYFGAYPGAMPMMNDEDRWKSYVKQSLIETVITKDVLLMHRIEKPALLRRLFELGTQYSGKILSFTKIMGQLQEAKNTTTLSHYLELLDHAGLLTGLQKFAMDQARKRNSSPKWQTMNNALMSSLNDYTFEQIQSDKTTWGRWVESAVGAHLLSHRGTDLNVYYWNESNAEVDFILDYRGRYIALEVKLNTDRISGLNAFKKHFNPSKIYQLDSSGLSWQHLIAMDPRGLF